jgi:DNA-directed RNA polymerase subunit RPC12/RpoP
MTALSPTRRGARRLPTILTALALLAGGLALDSPPAEARAGGGHSYLGHHASGPSSHASFSGGGAHAVPMRVRVGGGHSYSGGGRGGGGRGSGGFSSGPRYYGRSSGGGIGCGGFFFLLLLVIVILVVVTLINKNRGVGGAMLEAAPSAPPPPPADLEAIRAIDPDFSAVLFRDFLYALYARAHHARSSARDLDALAPYLAAGVRQSLAARPPAGVPVTAVVVGAMRVVDVRLPAGDPLPPDAGIGVEVEVEANLTEGEAAGARAQYVRERWRLLRAASAKSRTPENVRSFHCPHCGAPFEPASPSEGERCAYCGEVVGGGRFDWNVQAVSLLASDERPPALTGTVEEEGTDDPTIYHPDLAARRAALLADDPAATDEALAARLALLYGELNAAWNSLDLTKARPFVSDSLFDYLQYWIEAYRAQGLRNVTQGVHMMRSEIVKVVRDRYYDAVTFRVWGSGPDYTIDAKSGQVVGGDPRRDRAYTEYWTLIRGAGARGKPSTEKTCPNCGAPLAINMAGECEHCGAKVTSGRFDWVLSEIEQDDSYTG